MTVWEALTDEAVVQVNIASCLLAAGQMMGDEVFSVWSVRTVDHMGLAFTPSNISICMMSQGIAR